MTTYEFSAFTRRSWYVALLIVWAFVLSVLNPMGQTLRSGLLYEVWSMVWSGIFLAAPFLLAAWISLGAQPATRRIPMALALACFLVLLTLAGQQESMRDELTIPVFMGVALVSHALTLAIARRWLRWRVGIRALDRDTRRNQFTIITILMWTAVVGGLLGLANWLVGDWRQAVQFFSFGSLLRGLVLMSVASLILLPVGAAATGAALADWPRRRFAGWLFAISVVYSLGFGAIVFLLMIDGGGPAEEEAMKSACFPMLMLAGFVAAVLGTLVGLRGVGFGCGARGVGAKLTVNARFQRDEPTVEMGALRTHFLEADFHGGESPEQWLFVARDQGCDAF